MKHRLNKFYCDTNGQVMVFVLSILFVLVLFFLTIPNVTHIISAKMRTQTAADFGAYSAAVWQARGLNLIACLNIGIKMMYFTMIATVATYLVATALYFASYAPFCWWMMPIAVGLFTVFFASGDPASAAGNLTGDIQNLYDSATTLADYIGDIAQAIPAISLAEGTRIATDNMIHLQEPVSGLPLKGVVVPNPIDEIELVSDGGWISEIQEMASLMNWANPGGGGNGSITFDANGGISGSFSRSILKEVTIRQLFSKDTSIFHEYPPPNPNHQGYYENIHIYWPTRGQWNNTSFPLPPDGDEYPSWYPEPPELIKTFRRGIDFNNESDITTIQGYRPKGTELLPGGDNPINQGYEYERGYWNEHWEDTTITVEGQGGIPPVPQKPVGPLYAVGFTLHSSTKPIVANTPRTFQNSAFPLGIGLAIAQAAPYLTQHPDDSVFNPSWDAKLVPVTAIGDIISAVGFPGDLSDIIQDYLLLH